MKLKELFTFLPKSDKPASYGKESGIYPFFTSSNVINKYVDEADYSGEFLIIGDGGTGNCKYYNGAFSASDHNYVLKPINHKNTRLIRYFLMKDDYKVLNDGFKGVGIKNISKSYIGEIEYYKNSKYSDEFVVDSLDHINGEIDKLNNELFLFDELIKSRFNELFGDPLLNEYNFKTKELSKLTPFNSIKNTVVINSNTWLLNLDMIESDTGRIIEKVRTEEIGNSTIEFDTTCVLYSKLRPYLNKVAIPDENGIGTSELISMKCDSTIVTREYLASSLRHKSFVNYINSKTGGAKMPRANMDELRSFKMPIPPIELQNEFSSFVDQIDKLKFNVQKQIKYYQELLDLKMHEYFDVEEED